MTTDDITNILEHPDKPEHQVRFCQLLAQRWREQNDSKMANMYAAMAEQISKQLSETDREA